MTLEMTKGDTPIVAWRQWKFLFGGFLTDVNSAVLWEPRKTSEAFCLSTVGTDDDHFAPKLECTCGIYALKQRPTGRGYGSQLSGEVYLWGTVIETELGYRAQYAYPKNIKVNDPRLQFLLGWIEHTYGVPVEYETMEEDTKHSFAGMINTSPKLFTEQYLRQLIANPSLDLQTRRYFRTMHRARLVQKLKRYRRALDGLKLRYQRQLGFCNTIVIEINNLDDLLKQWSKEGGTGEA